MPASNTPATDFIIRLRDGRSMAIISVGQNDGFPIFHCHGSGSSRLEVMLLAAAAAKEGVRLIGLDRPGIGRSDPKVGYQLLDWPDDVVEIAEELGIGRFAIEGVSAGGPYALACAYKIPQRLTACGLISTISPDNFIRKAAPWSMRVIWWIGAQFPWLLRLYVPLVQRLMGSDLASIEKYLVRYAARLGVADHELLSNPQIREPLVQAMVESLRQGGEAGLEATLAELRWDFKVERIPFEKIFVWHGEQDRIMPVAPVRLLVQALPHCIATFYPDEGHFSTVVNHAQDILHTLRIQYSSTISPYVI